MPIGAAIGSAVVGAGASIYGANKAAGASNDALQASLEQQDKVWGAVNPYMTAGAGALGRLQDPNAFMTSPGYQFRLGQGLDAVTTNKAVNGLLKSGSALKAVNNYAQNTASSEYGNWWNQQSGLAGMGLQGAGIGAGVANSSQQAIQTNAANQGGAAMATGNAIAGFGGSIADLIAKYNGTGQPTSSYSSVATDPAATEYAGLI